MQRTTSPIGGRRACLCKDNTYSIECCKGLLLNQGIGSLTNQQNSSVTNTDTQQVLINNSNAVDFTCSDIGSTFTVSDTGVIGLSLGTGTLVSFTPSSFSAVTSTTSRSVVAKIKAPQGYANEESEIECTLTTDQNAPSLGCDDLTISGFAISDAGVITEPTVTVTSSSVSCSFTKSPSSYAVVTSDTVQTLTLTITVPANYHNTGGTISCTTTATQLRDTFECTSTTLSGFAVSQTGVVTAPSASVGTITSTSPSSFAIVSTNTTRTLTANITAPSTFLNSGSTIACTTTATQSLTPTFTCSDVTLSGFAVSQTGVVTLPSLSAGTIASSTPSSYAIVDTNTTRTLSLDINVPNGYFNTGSTVTCTTTATQVATPTFTCSDVTLSGFAVSQAGVVTLPSLSAGAISSSSPSSFAIVDTNTTRTLSVVITIPSGYFNTGSTVTCTTTATQTATPTFACSDVTISGFAVAGTGVVTAPTINVGTLVSVSPANGSNLGTVTVNTTRTATLTITAPSGYFNSGSNISCTTTATQPRPTLSISDINYSAQNPLTFAATGGAALNANVAQYGRSTGLFDDRDGDTSFDYGTEPRFNAFFAINTGLTAGTVNNYTIVNTIAGTGTLTLSGSTASIQVQASILVPSQYDNEGSTLATQIVGNVTRPAQMGNIHKVWTFTADYTQFTTYRITTTINSSTSVTQDLVLKGCTSLHSQTTPVVVSGRSDNPTFTDSGSTSTSWGCPQSNDETIYYSPVSTSAASTYASNDTQYDMTVGYHIPFRVKSVVSYCNFSSSGVNAGIVGATIYNKLLTDICSGDNEFTRQSESVTAFTDGHYATTSAVGAVSGGVVTSMS